MPHLGGGAGIYYEDGEPVESFILFWERIAHLNVPVGDCAFQTFWEFLTLAMCLVRWCPIRDNLIFCGDNTGSLNLALSMRASGINEAVAREIAWRAARYRWTYGVAHLPSESNTTADRLSRIRDPSLPPLAELPSCLVGAAEVKVSLADFWSLSA